MGERGGGGGKTMRFAQPGLSEGDLRAHFEYICARGGAQRPAYVPVVASGWVEFSSSLRWFFLNIKFRHIGRTP
jgi:hypothetical protein